MSTKTNETKSTKTTTAAVSKTDQARAAREAKATKTETPAAAPAPAAKPQSKAAFIRSCPTEMSASEVVAKAAAAGIVITPNQVYSARKSTGATNGSGTSVVHRESLILATIGKRVAAQAKYVAGWNKEGGHADNVVTLLNSADSLIKKAVDMLLEIPEGWSHTTPKAPKAPAAGATLVAGQHVAIREKFRPEFDALIDESELSGLTVKVQRANRVILTTKKGTPLIVERRVLEVVEAAAS